MQRVLDTTLPITLEPLDASSVTEGSPHAGAHPLTAINGVEVGVWEISQGAATDIEADEVFVVLSGSGTVAFEDGEVIDLIPGRAVRLRAGDRTTWTIHSTLRKIYVS